jgi:hypothetical protein
MELGHGFLPRVDARNFKAVERCLSRDGPSLFHEALDLPWVILEGPWSLQRGSATIEFCRNRSVQFLVDAQTWRYRDARTFSVEKFACVPYAPPAPLGSCNSTVLRSFVESCLEMQYSLGATAYLLPGVVPGSAADDTHGEALAILEIAESTLSANPLPCIAFIGVHASAMDQAHQLIDELPLWLEGVYLQITPVNPLHDSPAKIIDCLALAQRAVQRGFIVIAGRLAGIGPLARAIGVQGTDAGLGEGESFDCASKLRGQLPRQGNERGARPVSGRLYCPDLGRSLSSAEWARIMSVPVLRGQLLCRLACCAFGQPVESTPLRGREHSLHTRVSEAKQSAVGGGLAGIRQAIALLEQRQSVARAIRQGLVDARLDPINTEFIDNHLAAARYFGDAMDQVA